jgi:hypothetical protein
MEWENVSVRFVKEGNLEKMVERIEKDDGEME